MILKANKNKFLVFYESQKYFFKHIYKEHPISFISFFVLSMLSAGIPAILILLNKNTIDTITKLGTDSSYYKYALSLLLLNFVLQYCEAFIRTIEKYLLSRMAQTVNFVLKKMMLSKLIYMPLEEYENNRFFDRINLANSAISGNGIKVIGSIIGVLRNLISLISVFVILLTIHWTMPIALFLSTLPGIILIFIVKLKNYKMAVSTSAVSRELEFTDSLFINKSSIKELKLFGLGPYLIGRWSILYKQIQKKNLDVEFWEAKTQVLAVLFLQLASLGVSVLLVIQITQNNLTIGDYVALLGSVVTVQAIFSSIGGNLGSIFETAIFNEALIEILNYQEKGHADKKALTYEIEKIQKIELKNISFSYPSNKQKVLDDLSLTFNKGEKVSIVGYNGSGKTTLIKCLSGLYEVTDGSIYVNGIDTRSIKKENYFSFISAIFQDFFKYKFSIRDNIGFGDLKKREDDSHIYRLLKHVNLYDKVNSLDHLLETYLTREMPDGEDLSGGEWQKIAIARGFMKDADLIILDEPTAAMDPVSELEIFRIFNELSKDKTSITISHRLGPTKYADRIVVMDKGKIVEEGNYEELMLRKGLYYEMYISQLSWYQDTNIDEVTYGK
ncbi:ABC transporter ATP-binding protein [Lysinibacillus sp. FSL H8-0500]|uniref:ABC transporter ATP-binding protein n=1 Tax=Lysinibacillus sp. FSL H8-0500 TaxID=2921393 RepID=UPI003100FF73